MSEIIIKYMITEQIMLCESYHHALNSNFNSKPSISKFISVLRHEEIKLKYGNRKCKKLRNS